MKNKSKAHKKSNKTRHRSKHVLEGVATLSDQQVREFRNNEFLKFIKWLFYPAFDELAVGLMFYICTIAAITNSDARYFFAYSWKSGSVSLLICGALYFIAGCISIYHVFTDTPKSTATKRQLAIFASGFCMAGGLLGGYQLFLNGPNSLIQLFGLWNILQGLIIAFLMRLEYIDEKNCSDRDTPFRGAIFNFSILTLLYYWLAHIIELSIIDTISICIAYSASLSTFVCDQVSPLIGDNANSAEDASSIRKL